MKNIIKVILIFIVSFSMISVPKHFRTLFNESLCEGLSKNQLTNGYTGGCSFLPKNTMASIAHSHPPTYHWSFEHYIFIIFGIILCLLIATYDEI